jgi:hypothetical protein
MKYKCDNCGKIYKTVSGITKHCNDCIPTPVYYGSVGSMGCTTVDGEFALIFGWR